MIHRSRGERQLRSRYPDAILVDVQSGEAAAHFALGDDQSAALGSPLLKELPVDMVFDHFALDRRKSA